MWKSSVWHCKNTFVFINFTLHFFVFDNFKMAFLIKKTIIKKKEIKMNRQTNRQIRTSERERM